MDNKKYYVYMLIDNIWFVFVDGKKEQMKYIGERSTRKPIEKDWYYGSGKDLGKIQEFYKYVFPYEWRNEISKRFSKIILEECKSNKEVKEREKFYIKKYNALIRPDFYNRTPGGDGIDYESMTEEEKKYFLSNLGKKVKKGWENRSYESKEKYKKDCSVRMKSFWENISKEDLKYRCKRISEGEKRRFSNMSKEEKEEYCAMTKRVAIDRKKNMSKEDLEYRGKRISEGQNKISQERKNEINKRRSESLKATLQNPEIMKKRTKYKNKVIAINSKTFKCDEFETIYDAACYIGSTGASKRIFNTCCKPCKYANNQNMNVPKMIGYSKCEGYYFLFVEKEDIKLYSSCENYPKVDDIIEYYKA